VAWVLCCRWLRRRSSLVLFAATAAALIAGAALWLAGDRRGADIAWSAGTLIAAVPAVAWVISALRNRRAGVDVIAVLSLAGTLAGPKIRPQPGARQRPAARQR